MSPVGERGGSTRSLTEAEQLLEEHKGNWTALIRDRISAVLLDTGFFHASDLLDLGIPMEHKNAIGAVTGGFVRRGLMEETGVRRSSGDEAGHARKSAVYRITELGREKLAGVRVSDAGRTGADSGHISPDRSAELSMTAEQSPEGPTVPSGRLFEVPEVERPAADFRDPDQRAA